MKGIGWATEELRQALVGLSGQQIGGIVRLVQAELDGRTLTSLLEGSNKICTSATFYGRGKRRGWRSQPGFVRALDLARRDYRAWLLEHSTGEALTVLASTAPEAARALRQQVIGNEVAVAALETMLCTQDADLRRRAAEGLGRTGLARVAEPLRRALERERDPEALAALVEALGHVAGSRDGDRRTAAVAVLDRADIRTAGKAAASLNQDEYLDPLGHLSDEELEQVIANLMVVQAGAAGGECHNHYTQTDGTTDGEIHDGNGASSDKDRTGK